MLDSNLERVLVTGGWVAHSKFSEQYKDSMRWPDQITPPIDAPEAIGAGGVQRWEFAGGIAHAEPIFSFRGF